MGGNNIDVKETGWKNVDWINLAHDGNKWRSVVNAIMAFGVRKMRRISSADEQLSVLKDDSAPFSEG